MGKKLTNETLGRTVRQMAADRGMTPEALLIQLYVDASATVEKKQKSPATTNGAELEAESLNLAKPGDRKAYDRMVLKYMKQRGEKVAASDVRREVGGTALNVRAALNRLIEAGLVEYEGRARATRYEVKGA